MFITGFRIVGIRLIRYNTGHKGEFRHMEEGYSMDNLKFGRKVAELREAHGFSQYQLGELLKVSYQAVSK